jgi:hypothetical protein
MYGLVLENLAAFIKIQWGEAKWESVRRHCGIDAPSFSIHHVYAETVIPRLAKSATVVSYPPTLACTHILLRVRACVNIGAWSW